MEEFTLGLLSSSFLSHIIIGAAEVIPEKSGVEWSGVETAAARARLKLIDVK